MFRKVKNLIEKLKYYLKHKLTLPAILHRELFNILQKSITEIKA